MDVLCGLFLHIVTRIGTLREELEKNHDVSASLIMNFISKHLFTAGMTDTELYEVLKITAKRLCCFNTLD